jgi:hypothetical protein
MAQVEELTSRLGGLYLGPVHPERLDPETNAAVAKELSRLMRESFGVVHPLPLGPDAVVSGSALLASFPGYGGWVPNDLDIVCRRDAVPRLRDYFMRAGFGHVLTKSWRYTGRDTFTLEMWSDGDRSVMPEDRLAKMNDECRAAGLPPLDPRTRSRGTGPCVQLVIDHDMGRPMVFGRYDLHVLENTYDGQTVLVNYPQQVKSRASTLAPLPPGDGRGYRPNAWKRESRVEKYTARGIRIIQ